MTSAAALLTITGAVLAFTATTGRAQGDPQKAQVPVAAAAPIAQQASPPLDGPARSAAIAKIGTILDEYYVYPEVAVRMKARLQKQLKAGAYDGATSGQQFANLLSADLIEVSGDRHLGVRFDPNGVAPGETEMTPEQHARQNAQMTRSGETNNWGFVKAEILPGNIGYLDLRFFGHPDGAGDSAASAMAFLSRTDALIIDVRNNGGGYPQTVALLLSYLLERSSIHGGTEEIPLFLQNDRKAGATTEIRTLPYVPGKKYLNKDVYLLTGRHSFSGAELFAQALKTHKRATLVGETTAGATRSSLIRPINRVMEIAVSFGWTKDAVTGEDKDGQGIAPDVPVPAQIAREKAWLTALQKKQAIVAEPGEKQGITRAIAEAERALAAAQPKGPLDGNTAFSLKGYVNAKSVYLAGEFNRYDPQATQMVKNANGDGWIVKIDLPLGKHLYKFVVDGKWMLDPDNAEKGPDPTGWDSSVRTVPR